ncbi:MAG: hypothetical protein IKP98_00250 [Bacilli bacterium]|nr:hypothetical protein [Bacilli bacterium]
MDIQDYILVHGIITNIKDNVDNKFIWFDIRKDEYYKDKDGKMKNNPSFFSVRVSKNMKYKLETNIEIIVKGIPKGFVDKNGYRQNYIHATEINGLETNKYDGIISYDTDGVMLWNGKRCESTLISREEQEEIDKLIKECIGED